VRRGRSPPTALPAVRLSALTLPHAPHTLAEAHRPLVELVDLELEAVVAEVEEDVTLELTGRVVGDPAAAEVRVDGEPAEVCDPAAPVDLLELDHAGELPVLLDHEDAELGRLTQGALDPLERRLASFRPMAARKRERPPRGRGGRRRSRRRPARPRTKVTQRILRQDGGARAARPRSRAQPRQDQSEADEHRRPKRLVRGSATRRRARTPASGR
jgi:hypothetical protein